MAILGKRSRSLHFSSPAPVASATPRSTRAKRRAAENALRDFVIADDNEEDPFTTPRASQKRSHRAEENEGDELSLENQPARKRQDTKSTPSKHGRPETRITIDGGATPSTPRHRDSNLQKKIAVTPRHRVGLLSRALTPQSGRTPTTPRVNIPSVYDNARGLFRSSSQSTTIIGRDEERSELASFVTKRLDNKSSGCVYISGPPGTGKSALANEVCNEVLQHHAVPFSYLNCMSAKNAAGIFAKLFEDFCFENVMQGTETAHLKGLFQARKQPYLVILDEIDHLLDVDLELLYQLFEWSLQKKSSLVLIGIANALDLTDRFLPRLRSKGLKPQLIPFMPYSAAQVGSVVTSRLKSLMPADSESADYVPFIHPTAILFLSKKVAAQTGDLRKAFAICIRTLDLIESETRATLSKTNSELTPSASPSPSKAPLTENVNLSSPSSVRSPKKVARNVLGHLKMENAPRATIAHVARVTAGVFSAGSSQRLSALNIQQKAALCALSALERGLRERADIVAPTTPSKHANAAPTIRGLYEAYARLCKRDNVLQPLSLSEFRDVVVSLEGLSLVAWADGKNGSLAAACAGTPSRRGRPQKNVFGSMSIEDQRVASCVGTQELKTGLAGVGSGILLAIVEGDPL
jgi:cell division control protein 6